MSEVILSTDDLMVLGGPSSINVDVNYGPAGDRGSLIFAGEGIPSSTTTTDLDAKLFDMYINISPSSDEYMYLYQLTNDGVGGIQWTYLLKLVPTIYNDKKEFIFTAGSASATIPVTQIIAPGLYPNLTSSRLNIFTSITPDSNKPISSSVILGDIYLDSGNTEQWVVPVNINAIEYSGTWDAIEGARTVSLLISVV
jgi:hypothetical protein